MPDSDLDKAGMTSSRPSAVQEDSAHDGSEDRANETLEDELDRLLSEINAAVEELDPTGDLEHGAVSARSAAKVGDPEYDELEDMFEVVVPPGSETIEAEAPEATETDAVEDEGDGSIDQAKVAVGQIDQELDALLSEAQTLLEPEPEAETVGDAADAAGVDPDSSEAESATVAEPEPVEEAASDVAPATDPVEVPESAPEPADSASPESSRTIEDLDADLADRAETALETEAASGGGDDAFDSSEDVIEEVIEEMASASEELREGTEQDQQDTDELAQLMAESPASSDLGVGTTPADAAAPSGSVAQSHSPAQHAAAASEATTDAVRTKAGPGLVARVMTVAGAMTARARPLVLRVARTVSKPLELVPPRVRDDIGWFASVTLFLAFAVLIALALFR